MPHAPEATAAGFEIKLVKSEVYTPRRAVSLALGCLNKQQKERLSRVLGRVVQAKELAKEPAKPLAALPEPRP